MSFGDEYYTLKAKKLGIRARSYFKLEELDHKFKIIHDNNKILDLGAAPGSWIQYCRDKTKKKVSITSVDLKPIEPLNDFLFNHIVENINDISVNSLGRDYDVVLSDMAPNTSGIKGQDTYESYELVLKAFSICKNVLKDKGFFVAKYFQGEEFQELRNELKQFFNVLKQFKPKSSRKKSKEIFFIGIR
ncbi:MAG: RlmE family RNA methyltransferase [Candidatus Margulisbacteria bacterium]|nr:RlmE family RNA methyltransferase [Candidatus Margulisiibacteriota bacterium]